MEKKFDVTGMTCSACSARIEREVKKLDGVQQLTVNFLTNSLSVEYDENLLTDNKIMETVKKSGYGATLHQSSVASKTRSQSASGGNEQGSLMDEEIKGMKKRLIGSICFLIPLLYISMNHMLSQVGLPTPMFIMKLFHGAENSISFAFFQFILLLPILFFNQKYFTNGFKALWHRSPNMDSLIAIGAGAATIYGVYAIFRIGYGLGHGELDLVEKYSMDLYFESAGTILTLITVGKYLETKSKGKTSDAITKLMKLSPKTAFVEKDGITVELPVEDVQVNDIVVIKPGSIIPVDGIVTDGFSSVNEAAITGESLPVEKKAGDKVISATVNKNGFFKFQATKVGENTTLAQIIKLVEDASSSKAPIAKLADKISGVFVPIVICIAFAATLIWLLTGASFEFAMSIGIAVLVISCPCALGLATPVAIMVGTGKGAENGILIKSGEALEIAHRIDTVVLDKTGTITEGQPRVTDVTLIADNSNMDQVIGIAAAIEKFSEHPLAEAILTEAEQRKIPAYEAQNFEAVLGKGATAEIAGRKYFLGNEALMFQNAVDVTQGVEPLKQFAKQAKTPLLLAEEKTLLGIIAVADTIKQESKKAIDEFKKLGIDVIMLTGDNQHTADAIKDQLGISQAIAEVMPQDKEKKIGELKAEGHSVAMIGDGINDAPALVSADVGIAIGAGTDVAIESADIVLMKSSLLDAVTAVKLSKAVLRNIKQNLFWAFFYNSIGIPLAAGILFIPFGLKLNPMFGAAAMSLSSVCVVSNALRLKLFQTNYDKINHFTNDKEENIEEERKMKKINIEGMSCNHCSGAVEKVLKGLEGVTVDHISLEDKAAYVEGELDEQLVKKVIEEEGFTVTSIE